jgi:hypothetical protein
LAGLKTVLRMNRTAAWTAAMVYVLNARLPRAADLESGLQTRTSSGYIHVVLV